MQSFPNYQTVLPLANETSGYSRHVTVTSCRLNDTQLQVRGELVDSRADYYEPATEVPVHGIVVRLTIDIDGLVISAADIELPKLAFDQVCRRVPHSGVAMVGLSIKKNFLQKVEEIYGGDRSCFHIYSLLSAMAPTFMQVRHWNDSFPAMDRHMAPEAVPAAMLIMRNSVKDSCFAWRSDGEVVGDIDQEKYDPLLKRISPNLLARWKESKAKDKR